MFSIEAGRAAPDGYCVIGIAETIFKVEEVETSVAYYRVVPRGHTQATNAGKKAEISCYVHCNVKGKDSC